MLHQLGQEATGQFKGPNRPIIAIAVAGGLHNRSSIPQLRAYTTPSPSTSAAPMPGPSSPTSSASWSPTDSTLSW